MPNSKPNVGFKHGSQESMDKIVNTVIDGSYGTFYLTSDTSRLYVGNAENKIVPVNAGIITVDTLENLPQIPVSNEGKQALAGNYYYVTGSNILCVFNGQHWVQINSVVTNDDLTTDLASATDGVSITTTVKPSAGDDVSDSYTIKGTGGISVAIDPNSEGDVMTIAPTTPITVTAAAGTNDNSATVKVASSLATNNEQSFNIVGGTNVTSVEVSNNDITINVQDTKNTGMAVEKVVNGTGFTFSVSQAPGDDVTANFDPVITIGKTNSTTDVNFINGKAALSVYTIAQTDKLIKDELKLFNSMTYCGTRTADQGLPVTDVHVGDTYLINSDNFSFGGASYDKGTLAIARGTEDATTGVIIGNIEWDFVTGSKVDTQYAMSAITGGIKLIENEKDDVGQLVIKGDSQDESTDTSDEITVVSKGVVDGANQELIVQHKKYNPTTVNIDGDSSDTMESLEEFPILAVDSITTSNGHITGFTTKKYVVKDTNASLTDHSVTVTSTQENINKSVSVTHSVTLTPSAGDDQKKDASFQIDSLNDNLRVNASGTSVQMNLVWDTF